jgi:uncharacterized protein
MAIVSDSSPILSFARASRSELLHEVVHELIIPDAVYEEIVVQGAGKPGADEVRQSSWVKRQRVTDRSLIEKLPRSLEAGEREAIVLAKELGAVLLVDDREAREEADRLGIKTLGSLRVLQEAKELAFIPAIKPILDELIASDMYISDDLYQKFLQRVGEA